MRSQEKELRHQAIVAAVEYYKAQHKPKTSSNLVIVSLMPDVFLTNRKSRT